VTASNQPVKVVFKSDNLVAPEPSRHTCLVQVRPLFCKQAFGSANLHFQAGK